MSDFTLGQHDAAIKELLSGQARVEKDIAAIKDILAEQRGEKRVRSWIAGAAGAAAGMLFGLAIKLVEIMVRSRIGS